MSSLISSIPGISNSVSSISFDSNTIVSFNPFNFIQTAAQATTFNAKTQPHINNTPSFIPHTTLTSPSRVLLVFFPFPSVMGYWY
ncbi:MAG: hypothetical protein [Circular genetic element sp.]|nr:MAG: hypothetical protein [Circular genetic element sp.]